MSELVLKSVEAYLAEAYHEGFGSTPGYTQVIGYFKEESAATDAVKGQGSWGADGDVKIAELFTDGKTLYKVKNVGPFTDVDKKYREELTKKIKSKLTEEELAFLNIK